MPTPLVAQAIPSKTTQPEQELQFLRLSEVRTRVPLCEAQIYKMIAKGGFPRPYDLGGRARGWLRSDIEAWIKARVQVGA